MSVLILSAQRSEINSLLKSFRPQRIAAGKRFWIFRKDFDEKRIYFGVSGIGPKNIRRFFRTFFDFENNLQLVISTGYAGAIDARLKAGQAVYAASMIDPATGERLPACIPAEWKAARPHVFVTHGISLDSFAFEKEKRLLKKTYPDAGFVDMESLQTLKLCAGKGIKCAVVRGVSDEADFRFPDMDFVTDSWDMQTVRRLVCRSIKNPLNIIRFFRFQNKLLSARSTLSHELHNIVTELLRNDSELIKKDRP